MGQQLLVDQFQCCAIKAGQCISFCAYCPGGTHTDITLWLPLESSHLTWGSALSLHPPGWNSISLAVNFFFPVGVFSLITLNPVSWLCKCLMVLSRKFIFLLFVLGYKVHLCTNQAVILSCKMGFWGQHDSEALLACVSLCTALRGFILGKLNPYSKYCISDDNASTRYNYHNVFKIVSLEMHIWQHSFQLSVKFWSMFKRIWLLQWSNWNSVKNILFSWGNVSVPFFPELKSCYFLCIYLNLV